MEMGGSSFGEILSTAQPSCTADQSDFRSNPVFQIRIHRIHVFLGLPDQDPLVRGMDPDPALDTDPSIIKIIRKTLNLSIL
jgi:hypothetical protein